MLSHDCARCQRSNPPPKRCAACKKTWYCSSQCQRRDWVCHIFDCNPTRPITGADYIAFAVEHNRIPEHPEASAEYGFGNDTAQEHADKVLKLYTDLLHPDRLGVKPTIMHKWKTEGALIENMMRELQRLPEESRGDHIAWFLENPYVISEKSVQECQLQWTATVEQAMCQAVGFIGLSETLPPVDMRRYINSLSLHRQECLLFYSILLMGGIPNPSDPAWVKFGFAACKRPREPLLAKTFVALINSCSFDDFCAAYESASLVRLITNTCGICLAGSYTIALLSETPEVKSVWWLNQYIETSIDEGQESNPSFIPLKPIILFEYGFMNCKTPEDHRLLIDLYKAFFGNTGSNPLALHQARMEGRLFAHFTENLQYRLRPKGKYKRLLRNSYPVEEE